jgi:hypothetical protein
MYSMDNRLKILFVAYCFAKSGQTLIGVYKRCLRIAMELSHRGHEILFFCPGHEDYHDDLTRLAETRMVFIDFLFDEIMRDIDEPGRRGAFDALAQLDPDIVVIGEAPLSGILLEVTLYSVELGIPVVFLDNIYNPSFVTFFCRVHAPMADGVILTGPSSLYAAGAPAFVSQVPPYIEASPHEAKALLTDRLGLTGERLITVLAYDDNVEKLAISLLGRLEDDAVEMLFLTRNPAHCRQQLQRLPEALQAKVRVIAPPSDPILFGCIALSRLSVCKSGHMQMIESLSLGVPVLVFSYIRQFGAYFGFPRYYRRFMHSSLRSESDSSTLAAVRRLMAIHPHEMHNIHNGRFGAAALAADFIETLPRHPRDETRAECAALGMTDKVVDAVLATLHPKRVISVTQLRALRMKNRKYSQIFLLLCGYCVDGEKKFTRLEVEIYHCRLFLALDYLKLRLSRLERCVIYVSPADRLLVRSFLGCFYDMEGITG